MQDPKHLSQLKPAQRALVDQGVRDALLLIVHAQGKPVRIPIADALVITDTHRLVIEMDREAGFMILSAEKAETVLGPAPGSVWIDEEPKLDPDSWPDLVDPNAFRN